MGSKPRTTYRHGNVAVESIRVAHQIVRTKGADSLSIRHIARELGVAHRSLYNHFEDRAALLLALSASGFRRLHESLKPATGAHDFVQAYVRFALENPRLYGLMLRSRNESIQTDDDVGSAVRSVIEEAVRHFGHRSDDRETNHRNVLRSWMLLHGGVSLHLSQSLAPRSDNEFVDEMVKLFLLR